MHRLLLLIIPFFIASTSWALQLDSMDIPAQDFAFKDAGGKTHHLKDFSGRNVIVHFWASWCTSCSKEVPALVRLSNRSAEKNIQFLPISVDDADHLDKVRAFLKTLKEPIPLFTIVSTPNADRYWAWGLPITYLIRKNGMIFARAMGARNWDDIKTSDLEKIFKKEK